jgi:hypothetical protein
VISFLRTIIISYEYDFYKIRPGKKKKALNKLVEIKFKARFLKKPKKKKK